MTTALQICVNFSACKFGNLHGETQRKPIKFGIKLSAFRQDESFNLRLYKVGGERYSLFGEEKRDGFLVNSDKKRKKRVVVVRFNQGFGGGGGGGGEDDGPSARFLWNLALTIIFVYNMVTGQLGWLLDAMASITLLTAILPIVGAGAFLWWASRDIVQSSCPNCGNDFQIFKSTMNEELQLCPFCSQPFSVVDNEFVRDSVKFSNQSTTFADTFKGFSNSKKGKKTSAAIVDIEAEVKDAD